MILKRLFEDYDLAIERILVKESKRLKLTMKEMSVLLALFSIYKKRRTFTMASLSRRVELSNEEIGAAIESLIDKNMLIISLENKDGKEREVFSLDEVFLKIESLYRQDEIERIKNEELTYISQTIHLFEQGLGRSLLPYELENIRRWYEDKTYAHEAIIKAIESAKDKVSIKYVERILNQIIPEQVEIDSDVEKALDEVFKNIR
ncbi:MAG: DNA replication protein [Tenericutes bacterium HGW-Tenericutes-2]|jgi:DNA replication protein|nr:MAG: DNA replication protein [Tenericutes bacterium HGW-Tenericutes-2]